MRRTTYLHSGWEFADQAWQGRPPEYGESPGWLSAQVPGHVHLDLVRHGVILDPFTAMGELGCQWVDDHDWSYRTAFEWHPDPENPIRVLHFEGLDTICEVFLNDEKIAEHDNMFLPLEIDVSGKIVAGANTIRVDFQSAIRVGNERRASYFEKEGLPLDTSCFFERAFVRKAQYMFGWDWGPRLVSCGIWKPVKLIESPSPVGGGVGEGVAGQPGQAQPLTRPQIRLLREPDAHGESFEFEVDGKRVWMRGANWIPDHSFPSTIDRRQLRDRLEKAKDMGFNMLRVWGGGLYESDDFYELCDELGIFVWQDFPFACGYYPDDEASLETYRKEAEYHVERLKKHPCLALWCGNNENEMLHHGHWAGDKGPPRYYGNDAFHRVFKEVVERIDPSTPYIATSPLAEPGSNDPNCGGCGDQHYWDVWHGRGDWRHYADSTARFSSEFGFASSCSLGVWDKVLDEWAEDYPFIQDDPVLKWHDKTRKGWNTFVGFVRLHYPEPKSLADWVYYSQLNQRDAMRFAIEHYRRSDFCRGALIWQLNDCWPVQSWSILDCDGNYKAVAYELRRLYDEDLLSIERHNDLIKVHAVNDRDRLSGTVSLDAYHIATGAHLANLGMAELELGEDERKVVLEASVKGLAVPDTILFATPLPLDASIASERGRGQGVGVCEAGFSSRVPSAATWALLAEPKNARWPMPEPITVSISREDVLQFQTSQPLVDLMFTDSEDVANFPDNFLTLIQPGKHEIRYHGSGDRLRARSLAGWHQIRLVKTPL